MNLLQEIGIFGYNLQYSENIKMRFQHLTKNISAEIKKLKVLLSHKFNIVKPLPHMVNPYILDLGNLPLGETKTFTLTYFAIGHQRLLLAARTLINIPGFTARFVRPVTSPPDRFSIFFNPADPKKCGKYRNIEDRKTYSTDCMLCRRLSDLDDKKCNICELKLCHAHSYDFDLKLIHQREIERSRKAIWDYYSRLIQGFKDHRDSFILTEIYENDTSGSETVQPEEDFKLVIEFTPTEEFYEAGYTFDDLLLIDVSFLGVFYYGEITNPDTLQIHLGPTIPIILQGRIVMFDDEDE